MQITPDLIDAWARSGMEQNAFARMMGINENTFRRRVGESKIKTLAAKTNNHYRSIDIPANDVPPEYFKPSPVYLNAAVFDIETTDFKASGLKGIMTCGCVLPLNGDDIDTVTLNYDDFMDDRRALSAFVEVMSRYDILIGHFVTGYDLPWLFTRIEFHHLERPKSWLIVDTCNMAKRMSLKSERKTLDALTDFYRLEPNKTKIQTVAWNEIRSHDEAAFNWARKCQIEHCEADVISNRAIFNAMWPSYITLQGSPFQRTKW